MPTTIKFRRGTTAQNDSFTGANGEITFDHQLKELRVHDGVTQGGHIIRSTNSAASAATTFGANVTFNATSTFNGTLNINGNVNVGDAAGDTLQVTSTSSLNGNTTIGNANTDQLTVTARVASSLIPAANITYDLGSVEHSWRDLYLSGSTIRLGSIEIKDTGGSLSVVQAGTSTPAPSDYMTVANTQALYSTLQSNSATWAALTSTNNDIRAIFNSYYTSAQIDALAADYELRATANTRLANTNTAIADRIQVANATLLISDRMQVANTNLLVNDRIQVANATLLINDRMQVANTNLLVNDRIQVANATLLINDRMQVANVVALVSNDTANTDAKVATKMSVANTQTLYTNITANLNSYIANTNPRITNLLTSVGGTNTALRTLVSDRMQVANTFALTNDRMQVANTNLLVNDRIQVANATLLINDRMQVANVATAISTAVAALVDSAPATLDTLNELATALGNDASFATTLTTNLSQKLGASASVTLSGDVTGTASFSSNAVTVSTDIAATGTQTGVFGAASKIPVITVAADGRITNIANADVSAVTNFTYTAANNTLRISTSDGSTYDAVIAQGEWDRYMTVANTQQLISNETANTDAKVATKMSVANTQALHSSITANLNSYIANTNPRITNIIATVNDRMQVANATLLINDRMQVANTNLLVNDRMQVANAQALYTNATANLNSYIANTNPRIANILTSIGGTNTAIRTLVADRLQVANATLLINDRMQVANTNLLVNDRLQVANAAATYLAKAGGTMTGFITLHADPTSALHATTKQYVDNVSAGIMAAPQADAATTANLSGTYNNGTAGVGATFTIAPAATLTIDDVGFDTLYQGLLIKNQTSALQNGRYYLSQVGDAGTAWIFTRCGYCDTADEIPGKFIFVTGGTQNGQTGWVQHVDDPATFTVGTDDIDLFQFSGAGTYTAGTDLDLVGTTFSLEQTISSNTTGNAATSTKLATARSIGLGGDLSGSASFDGSQNITITATVADDSHNHIISNVDGLQTALNNKMSVANTQALANARLGATAGITLTGAVTGSGSFSGNTVSITTTATSDPTLTINGDASGSATFTNLGNATLTLTVADDSHNHIIDNVDGLQTALNNKMSVANTQALANARLGAAATVTLTGDVTGSASFSGNTVTITTTLATNETDNVEFNTINVSDDFVIASATATRTSTAQAAIATFSAATYSGAKIIVSAKRGTATHITEALITHDGTTVFLSEYGTATTDGLLFTLDADINTGNVRILATPSSATSTVFRVAESLITI